MDNVCSHAACRKPLKQALQCAQCKAAKYCSKDCQKKAWKAGHKSECVPAFEPGSTVVVVSLVSRSGLNGRRAIVQDVVSGSGRYVVQVDGEQVALKPGNLQPAPALGSTVILVSLVSNSDLNGRRGIVHEFKCETTRFEVKVDGKEAILSLKPQNLREVVGCTAAMLRFAEKVNREGQGKTYYTKKLSVLMKMQELAKAENWLALSDITDDALQTARELREFQPIDAAAIYNLAGICHENLGHIAEKRRIAEENYHHAIRMQEQCCEISKQLGNRAIQAISYHGQGKCYYYLRDYDKAMELLKQSLVIDQERGYRAGQGMTYSQLGSCHEELGDYVEAIKLFKLSLEIVEEDPLQQSRAEEHPDEGSILANDPTWKYKFRNYNALGNCYQSLGQNGEAIKMYQKSLAISKEEGDRKELASLCNRLGHCYHSLDQYAEAIEMHEQALALYKEVVDRTEQGREYNNLGSCYLPLATAAMNAAKKAAGLLLTGAHTGADELCVCLASVIPRVEHMCNKAIEAFNQALVISKEVGDRPEQGPMYRLKVYNDLGVCYWLLGQYEHLYSLREFYDQGRHAEAVKLLKRSLAIFIRICGTDDATHYAEAVKKDEAVTKAAAGLGLAAPTGVQARKEEARIDTDELVRQLRLVPRVQHIYENAIKMYEQALAISEEVGDKGDVTRGNMQNVAIRFRNLGSELYDMGRPAGAVKHLERSLAIFRKVLDEEHPDVISTLNNIKALRSKLRETRRRVRVRGLVNAPQWNGLTGIIIKKVDEEHVCQHTCLLPPTHVRVELTDEGRTRLSLKLDNLEDVQCGARGEPTAAQQLVVEKVKELAEADSWKALSVMAGDALRTARELREVAPQWAAPTYGRVGDCYQKLGQNAKAIEPFEKALAILKEMGDRAGQGAAFNDLAKRLQAPTLNDLGDCYLSLGQYAKAMELYEQALVIYKEMGDRAGQAKTLNGLGNCYQKLIQKYKILDFWKRDLTKAMELFEKALTINKELGNRAGQGANLAGLAICYRSLGKEAKAMELLEQSLTIDKELGDRAGQAKSLNGLANGYRSLGQYAKAMELFEQAMAIFKELGDRAAQGAADNNIGAVLALSGDGTAAARALARGLVVWQRVEQDVGEHDDRRVSVFEEQQTTYMHLQGVLLGQGRQAAGWALGVAAEGKGRALAYRLGSGGGGDGDDGGDQSVERPYEDMCEAWWAEVQRLARAEGAATRVLEYSFVFSHEAGTLEQRLAIWVVSGATGELLSSKVVSSTELGGSRGRSIQKVLAEARSSMNVRGRDAMRDARNARGRGRRNTRGGDRGHLFSYLLKLGQEYARAFRAVSADSRGLEFAQVRPGGQNIPSQAAPAQTITFLPGCTDGSAASSASVSLFEKMPAEVLLNYVFPQLDFMSLMNLLYSCKSFRNLEVMHPPQTAARSFVVKTALQHINILDACNLDLEMILDPEIIRAWMGENDGSEVLDFNYFDFYKRQFYRQPAGELGDQDDTPQTGTSFSFWEYLGRERPDPGDSDEKLEWFTHEIDSELNTIRDKVLESFAELHNPPADHLTIQTQQVCAALIRKRYASLTCSQTDGSSFSVFDQLRHEVEQRRAAAVDLHRRLQDVNETLLFHSILHKLSKGELECVEEWIEEWIGIYRDGEMEATVSTGAPTRNATERAKPSGVAEREQIIRAWALEMLHKLRVRSFEREMGGVVGYCNNFSHLAQSYSSHQTTGAASERKKVKETWEVIRKKQHAEEIASETSLLKELYQALIAPVEGALEGAEEVLIVPHKELFEVPWAALTDADGGYLIERYVIRTSPSLRVARQATDKMQQDGNEPRGHVVLVGNPLPTRLGPLCFAENEVKDIEKTLKMANLEVLEEHCFRSNLTPPATKTNVKRSLEGATWVHVACHADLETDALVLADPSNGTDQDSDLTMHEVQGSEGAKGVRLAQGATVVLSACNTGRGEIKAEGVVGLARGFMLANASATVVSLWSVDDGSTAALMCITYQHLAKTQGCTVPQALRLAMLRLARRPDPLAVRRHDGDGARGSSGGGSTTGVYQTNSILRDGSEVEYEAFLAEDVVDGLKEEWKRPMHWAAFLVVGAVTRLPALPSHTPSQPQVSGGAGESDSTPLVEAESYGCSFLEAVTD